MKRLLMLLVLLCFAAPSFALTGVTLGIRGGMVTNYDQETLALPGADLADMNLVGGQVKISTLPLFDVLIAGDYAWKNQSQTYGSDVFELKRHDFVFSATALYPIKLQLVSPYLGGGLSSHTLGFDYTRPLSLSLEDNDIAVPENESRLGYHLVGGAEIAPPAFPLTFTAEYRLNWIDTPVKVTKYNSISVSANFKLP